MWGALQKNAQALASIAAEQAQKGIASANQLLEKLDGQLDGDEEEEEDENDNKDPKRAEKVADMEEDSKDPLLTEAVVADKDVPLETRMRSDDKPSHIADSKVKQMSSMHYDDRMDKSIDDELDQLLLDDDAIDTEETKIAVSVTCDEEKPSIEGHVSNYVVAEKVKTPSAVPRADESPEGRPQNQGNSLVPPIKLSHASDQVCHTEFPCVLTFVRISITRWRCFTNFYKFTGRVIEDGSRHLNLRSQSTQKAFKR